MIENRISKGTDCLNYALESALTSLKLMIALRNVLAAGGKKQ